ncbi:hypothetical protein pb186bvf_016866 [Paramecium bursaria]
MDEIQNLIIQLQSYFNRPDSSLGPYIEETIMSILELQNLVLKQLFENHYQDYKIQTSNVQEYFLNLKKFWNDNRNAKRIHPDKLEETRRALKQIIIQNQNQSRRLKTEEFHDIYAELQQKDTQISILGMKLDAAQRYKSREQDKQIYQRMMIEIRSRDEIIEQLQAKLKTEKQQFDLQFKTLQENQKSLAKSNVKPRDVKILEEENERLKKMHQEEIDKNQHLQDKIHQKQKDAADVKELNRLRNENQRIIDENKKLQDNLHKLYDELKLDNLNLFKEEKEKLEKDNMKLQNQIKKLNEDNQLLKDDKEKLKKKIDHLRQNQNIKVTALPEIRDVPSHFNVIIQVLENIPNFTAIVDNEDQVCQIIKQYFNFLQGQGEIPAAEQAQKLCQLLPIDAQLDNRGNDLMFQVIDHLSKIVLKPDGQPESPIAKIIQAPDSPIYDMFFFLQRVIDLNQEIQPNEIPLINSIKHIRYYENIAKQCKQFTTYLKLLIQLEGQENKIDDSQAPFNYLVFPQILLLNVYELSLAKIDLQIDLELNSTVLNSTTNLKYELLAIIHSATVDKQIQYYGTLKKDNHWFQILFDKSEVIEIDQILTFKKPQNDKELLIYQAI